MQLTKISYLYILLFAFSGFVSCKAQKKSGSTGENDNIGFYKHIINTLAADSLEGRGAGTPGVLKAEEFLSLFLKKFHNKDYSFNKDTFAYCCRNNDSVVAHNLWLWPNDTSRKIIVFCAHYDHLPRGSLYSKEVWDKNLIHPGADDNASGVALAISLFQYYYNLHDTAFNVALILFSGHEEGLHGSSYWAKTKLTVLKKPDMLINFDMVGRLSETTSTISIRTVESSLNEKIYAVEQISEIKALVTDEKHTDTDSYAFSLKGIPSFTVTTGIHNDYHKASDKPDKINYDGIEKILNFIMRLL